MESLAKRPIYKYVVLICIVGTICGIIILGYLCSDQVCALTSLVERQSRYGNWAKLSLTRVISDNMGKPLSFLSHPLTGTRTKLSYEDLIKDKDFQFNIKDSDVMVFLHMQKTGGTAFGRHLVRDLDLEEPCQCKEGKKKCLCFRPSSDKYWLFSRYSTGWKCGLHADWTELTNCVDTAMDKTEHKAAKRRYFYVTLLRDPVARFLSEFRHVQRGATWKTALHLCGGRSPTKEELPRCYDGETWEDVTLEEFMNCDSNLAINRQTRMLADLNLVGCYNRSAMSKRERDVILLASAKQNLQKMAFFGLCEYQKISQYLFENMFHLYFRQPFMQINATYSRLTLNEISEEDITKIKELNYLDIALYSFAKSLLFDRFKRMKALDPDFEENFKNLGLRHSHIDKLFDSDSS